VTAGVLLGLPAIAMGTGLIWQEYTQLSRQLATKQRRIHAIFNYLLLKNNGRISVTSFMQTTHLSSKEAQKFLEQQATLCEKYSKICQDGEIYYDFENDLS
jgi:serine/threonine-protein kinase